MKIDNKIINIWAVIICFGFSFCGDSIDHTKYELGNIVEYFPHLEIYNVKKIESSSKESITYKVNNNKIADIQWKSKTIFDSVYHILPKEFDLFMSDSNKVIYEYGDDAIKFYNSTYSTNNTVDLLDGAYKFAVEKDYGFNLLSAMHFYDLGIEFMVVSLNIQMEEKKKYTVSLYYEAGLERYFEVVYESYDPLEMKDYLIISEVINSIQFNKKKIIPPMNEISNRVRVEL